MIRAYRFDWTEYYNSEKNVTRLPDTTVDRRIVRAHKKTGLRGNCGATLIESVTFTL